MKFTSLLVSAVIAISSSHFAEAHDVRVDGSRGKPGKREHVKHSPKTVERVGDLRVNPMDPRSDCSDDPNWYAEDEYGRYDCGNINDWDVEGCPEFAGDVGVDGTTASEACCICKADGCTDLSGWTDSYGDGCEWYEENNDEGACEEYGDDVGTDGKTPVDACCICKADGCTDLSGWTDPYGDGCEWYEENNDEGACEEGGDDVGTDGKTAKDACCVCQATGSPPSGDDSHSSDDDDAHVQPIPDDLYSPFQIYSVDSPGDCFLSPEQVSRLKELGASKLMCPFGVIVIGTSSFEDVFLKMAANILASILDQDGDGVPDDLDIITSLKHQNDFDHKGSVLSCGSTQEEESALDALGNVFDYAFSCQVWKKGGSLDRRLIDAVLMEEAFHMVHQNGYAWVYPEEFGMEDYTSSIVAREVARLTCVEPGYFHSENECPPDSPREPGNPAPVPLEGGCNYPSCDVAEFYKMAIFLARGMGWDNDPNTPEVWTSDYMPTEQQDVLDMLSTEFKDMINDPRFHQIQGPLTSEYGVASAANWFP